MSIHLFSHHNWKWILLEAAASEEGCCPFVDESNQDMMELRICKRILDLPSQRHLSKPVKMYSLFRVECEPQTGMQEKDLQKSRMSTWATSTAFAFLDPKDALFRALEEKGCSRLMPPTFLLPWDISDESEVERTLLSDPTHAFNLPALLKAPLGSGGFGLYIVNNTSDIVTIIRRHAGKAENEVDFIEKLKCDHGGHIPQWSLQKMLNSVRVRGGLKMQLRCHAVIVERAHLSPACYLYCKDIEVRIPTWEIDEEEEEKGSGPGNSPVDIFEDEITTGTTAKPYNRGRNKSVTDRALLWEMEGNIPLARDQVLACTRDALVALKSKIEDHIAKSHSLVSVPSDSNGGDPLSYLTSMVGICGIDLMLSQENEDTTSAQATNTEACTQTGYHCHIVELNHNPAMPGPSKRMSSAYREHLKRLVRDIVKLGLRGCIDEGESLAPPLGFENVWG